MRAMKSGSCTVSDGDAGGAHPGDRRAAERQLRIGLVEQRIAPVARRVGGQHVGRERLGLARPRAAGHVHAAEARPRRARWRARRIVLIEKGKPVSVSSGAHQHHAPHAVDHGGRGQQRDQRAGRMAEDVEGAAAVGQHDLLEELVEVADVVEEAVDIAALPGRAAAGRSRPGRASRGSPSRGRAAPRSRIVSKYFSMHSLRPGRMTTVPLSGRAGGREARIAELQPSRAVRKPPVAFSGDGIAGDFVKEARS